MQLTDKIQTKINDFYKGKHTRKKKRKEKRQAGNNNKINVSVFEMYFTAVSLRERKNNFWFGKIKKCI